MNLFHNMAEGLIQMLDLWFGQGEGTSILIISFILIAVGYIAAGFIKTRKSKLILFSAVILLALFCDFIYLSYDFLGHMFSPLIFGAIVMMFLGLVVRYILQFLFAKRTIH